MSTIVDTQTKNFIVTDRGDFINLNNLSKVMWGGNWTTPDTTKVTYYFPITKGTGATLTYSYANGNIAYEAYQRFLKQIDTTGIVTDLRPPQNVSFTIDDITPNTGLAESGGTLITIIGNTFSLTPNGVIIYVAGVKCANVKVTNTYLNFITPANTSGNYDVTYFDDKGNFVLITGGLTYA